jgi:chemotaxis protein MotB
MKQLQYESGEARIKPEGYQTLDQLVALLKESPADQLIRVEGHADSMEIGPTLKSMYPTNWDLSKARATGVLRYLVEKGGIDSARISSIGYGATKPLMNNATEAGRSKNRRVDVVLYSPNAAPGDPEPPTSPAEAAVADSYRVSGLRSTTQEPAPPSVDKAAPVEASNTDKPAPTPPVVSETPSDIAQPDVSQPAPAAPGQ